MNAPDAPAAPETSTRAVVAAPASNRGIRAAAVLALLGLLVTVVHLIWPSPLNFTLFMFVGQGAFGLAMLLYAWNIVRDLRRRRAL
jgi:hypothetical protein